MVGVLKHSWRSWKTARLTAILAICALAVGIAATTSIFSVVEAVLLKPFAYEHAERFGEVVNVSRSNPKDHSGLSYPDILEFRERTRVFDVYGGFAPADFNLSSPRPPRHVRGALVEAALADHLGVNPVIGRWFQDAAHEPAGAAVVVISHHLWVELGSDPGIAGKSVTLDGRPYTVTGVMPPWFRLPVEEARNDVWISLSRGGDNLTRQHGIFFSYGRLKPGVTFAQANEDLRRVAAQLEREHPEDRAGVSADILPLREWVVGEIRPTLLLLLGAAAMLLLIVCANVAGLLLARTFSRARETALRVALGAARWQLGLQYFSEGLILAAPAALAGVFLSFGLIRGILALATADIPRADEVGVNRTVLAFALLVTVAATAFFSLAPLWQALRIQPNEALVEEARASTGVRGRRLSRWLVVGEIALAFVLLAAGWLLAGHLRELRAMPTGISTDHVITFPVTVARARYPDTARLAPYQTQLVRSLKAIGGVENAGFVDHLPLDGCCFVTTLYPEGRPASERPPPSILFLTVSSGYFQTMGIPLLHGRFFTERDNDSNPIPSAIINETAARHYWPAGNAIDAIGRVSSPTGDRIRIVGVGRDIRNKSLSDPVQAELYFPYAETYAPRMQFVVRSTLPLETLRRDIQSAVQRLNPDQPVSSFRTMNEVLQSSLARERLQSFMVAFLALTAVFLAMLGVFGLVSYTVRQRRVEIGTRMALGAGTGNLMRLVLNDGLRMGAYGVGIGAIAVLILARLLSAKVPGVAISGPGSLLLPGLAVALFSVVACLVPAWRATLLSPMVAIRNDPGSIWRGAHRRLQELAAQAGRFERGSAASTSGQTTLVQDIGAASQSAESFPDAIKLALQRIRDGLSAESAALLVQRGDGQPYRCMTSAPDSCGNHWSIPSESVLVGRLRQYGKALPLTPEDLRSWNRWAAEAEPRHLAEIQTLLEMGVALAVPIVSGSRIDAVLLMGRHSPQAYGPSDLRALEAAASQVALMLENAKLSDRIVEQERLRRELMLATEIQKRLFPEKAPEMAAVELSGVCVPARGVGGDYYDFIELDGGRLGIALADVAGKGIGAALIMSVVQASLRSLAHSNGDSLASLASQINRLLHRSTGSSSYATFFYAQIDEKNKRLLYVNAGHNPPYLLRGNGAGEIEELAASGTIIGMFPESQYEEAVLQLRSGDVFLVFTDGVPEALNPRDEEFGEDRLKSALRELAQFPVDEMASRLLQRLKNWIDDAAQYDDLTFVLMKVR